MRADRLCPECQTFFDPPRSDAKFCSVACRMRAYRRRRIEQLAEAEDLKRFTAEAEKVANAGAVEEGKL
jgi:hypothetical protein